MANTYYIEAKPYLKPKYREFFQRHGITYENEDLYGFEGVVLPSDKHKKREVLAEIRKIRLAWLR